MPSQLQRRLQHLLDPSVARIINGLSAVSIVDSQTPPTNAELHDLTTQPPRNTRQHWAGTAFGTLMHDIQSVVIHGTSGWPSYASADNFRVVFDSTAPYKIIQPPHQQPQMWYSKRGVGPQYFVESNGTIYPLIGPENLEGTPQTTGHAEYMNPLSLGIENSDGGDESGIATTSSLFHRLAPDPATAPDLAGMQLFALLHPGGAEDINLIWFALFPAFTGPGDIEPARKSQRYGGWRNTLFTERDYRSLALLCRFVAERNAIPRNFPVLPFATVADDVANADVFRKLLLADPLAEQIATKLGVVLADARLGGPPFAHTYGQHADWWGRFFGLTAGNGRTVPCFRGFMSHSINGHHACPGPLFDWHRFAREVWDWWWYPFDFDSLSVTDPKGCSTVIRPYRQARGDTPLVEYYYDAVGTVVDYNERKSTLSAADRFTLEPSTPIYALANGVAIAAALPQTSDSTKPGFVLTRHEVFHVTAAFSGTRIDYDRPPTNVWSLITYMTAPGMSVSQLVDANPDWLNRFVIRLTETERAVAFHAANPALAALTHGWAHQPAAPDPLSPAVRRPSTGTAIESDATVYRAVVNDLIAGKPVLFPLANDTNVTPVTILLGDYLGTAGTMPGGAFGIQVEIFSIDKLDVPGAAQRAVSMVGETWWAQMSGPIRFQTSATDLPANGMVWQYSMTNFLQWLNGITWAGEWPKYGAVDPANGNAPVPLPVRPNPRINL
ncbi:MAG: hypothetical protein ABJF01_10035 [bacterium]